jgi:electron transport complex protein RnfE
LTITFNEDYSGFLLAILPPGAFFGLAILIAAKNVMHLQANAKDNDTLGDGSLESQSV